MVDNLGLTLTPDSMITFRDATWPMLVMSFLAFAGNTFYPCFLRLLIWTIYKIAPATSSLKESLRFLLDHPRRCYTLLFPSTATWILASILFALNFIDTLLIVVLDLDNPEVNSLPVGPRILAAIFQSASSRHTGTSTFNLANVNPAVQFSLLVMMYISIYPIAISIRMSESYEEKSVGIYAAEENLDEQKDSKTYLISHMRNQLSFDLWYIFLGVFCICIAESERIMSREDYVRLTLVPRSIPFNDSFLRHGLLTIRTRLSPSLPSSSKSFLRTAMSVSRSVTRPISLRCLATSTRLVKSSFAP
jgi:Trk-type K+ transport system membrane component